MINIILADDHNIVRNGIKNLLEKDSDIRVAGEAFDGEHVLKLLDSGTQADIILADMNMPKLGGIELADKLKAAGNPVKVILLTIHDHRNHILNAFQSGVSAYLFKNISAEELVFAIKHVYGGSRYLCLELSERLLDEMLLSPSLKISNQTTNITFSEREISILKLMVEGYTNKEIAERLFTSKRTVEGHRQAMINKTGVRNTPALIRFVLKNGVLD